MENITTEFRLQKAEQLLEYMRIFLANKEWESFDSIPIDDTAICVDSTIDVGDILIDGAGGLAFGAWGGNGASYGNSGGIMAAGKQLFKRFFLIRRQESITQKQHMDLVGNMFSNRCFNL